MSRLQAWLARTSLADRLAVALGLVVVVLVVLLADPTIPGVEPRSFDAGGAAILVLAVGVLPLSRRAPATTALVELGLSIVWYGVGYNTRLVDIPTLVAFYLLGKTGDRVKQVGVGGLSVGALLLSAFGDDGAETALTGICLTVATILCGELVRSRQLLVQQLAERASAAEADRDAEAERRVTEERLRIARDVHDVLAHTVSVMTVQAAVATDAVDRDPAKVRAALATIRSAGKEAMAEIRTTVSVLRDTSPVATAPAPGIDRIDDVVDAARAQGLDVELDVDLAARDVEDLVQVTAYRVVQESLTNVVRHANASWARVHIERTAGGLVVEVTDDGRSPLASVCQPSAGYGLRGMTERVEAVGGVLSHGPGADGGWVVRAALPSRTGRTGRASRS